MAAVRSCGNKSTEQRLAALFRCNGIKGWRRHSALPGKPDFVFRQQRIALFVDGCFWHGCPRHLRLPATNREYWKKKIARNRLRDRNVTLKLRENGWCVLRVWEHEFARETRLLSRVARALRQIEKS